MSHFSMAVIADNIIHVYIQIPLIEWTNNNLINQSKNYRPKFGIKQLKFTTVKNDSQTE